MKATACALVIVLLCAVAFGGEQSSATAGDGTKSGLGAAAAGGAGKESVAVSTESLVIQPAPSDKTLRVPPGFRAKEGTTPEPYANTGWAKEIVHEKTGMEMVFIPAGEFMMGSPSGEIGRFDDEGPVHRVRITKSFYLGKHEVTVGQWKKFADETGHRAEAEAAGGAYVCDSAGNWGKKADANWHNPYFTQADSHPVTCVSWNDSHRFCQWGGLMLPTEAQWEYACRAGTTTAYQWGDSRDSGSGWCNGPDQSSWSRFSGWPPFSWVDGYIYTSPVGSFRANAWGLYDMHGNVSEWCADRFGKYPSGAVDDPQGPTSGEHRVMRNCSWLGDCRECRSAYREFREPTEAGVYYGVRVARTLD